MSVQPAPRTRVRPTARAVAALFLCAAASAPALCRADDAPSLASDTALPQVVVEGEHPRDRTGRIDATSEQMSGAPGSMGDVMRGLQTLPGVAVADDGSAQPAIRGSGPQDNAYYLDTLPIGYLFHADGLVSVLHSDMVSDFSLYSSAFGPRYDDVTGAVIDVRERAPRTDRFHGTVIAGVAGIEGEAEGPVGESQSYAIAARRSFADLVRKNVTDSSSGVVVELPRYGDYQGRYYWNLEGGGRLALHVNGANDHLGFDIPNSSQYAQHDPVLAGSATVNQAYATQALVWDTSPMPGATSQLAAVHMLDRSDAIVGSSGSVLATINTNFVREEFQFRPAPAHDLLLGAQVGTNSIGVQFAGHDPICTQFDPGCDITSAPLKQLDAHLQLSGQNVHVNDRWALASDLTLVLGARWSHEDYLHRSYAEPRISLEWEATANGLLTVGWGRHNQFPSGEQVTPNIGNTHLLHLQSDHAVLGWSQRYGAGWSWKTEAYYKTFSDLVTSDPVLLYANAGSGKAWGLESLLKKDSTGPWSGWMSVSLSHSERHDDTTGASFPYAVDQPVIVTLVGEYRWSERWKVGLHYGFHTGSPYTPVVGTGAYPDGRVQPLYGAIDSQRFPNYQRLDLRFDHRRSERLSEFFEILNLTNRKNVNDFLYSADYSTHQDVSQTPLMLSAGLQYTF